MKKINQIKQGSLFIEVFFVLLLVISFISYVASEIDTTHEILNLEHNINSKTLLSESLCSQLLLNEGLPNQWNSTTIELFGLKEINSTRLSSSKITAIGDISREKQVNLGLKEFSIYIYNLTNYILLSNLSHFENSTISHSNLCYGFDSLNREILIEVRT